MSNGVTVAPDPDQLGFNCAVAEQSSGVVGARSAPGKAAGLAYWSSVPLSVPMVGQVIVNVTSVAGICEPERSVGICAVMPKGILPVLSRQKLNGEEVTPGTNVSVNPVIDVVFPSGQFVPGAIAKEAVDAVSVFGDSAAVFDCKLANVMPPTKATTAPIVPMALAIGLILRSFIIPFPPLN